MYIFAAQNNGATPPQKIPTDEEFEELQLLAVSWQDGNVQIFVNTNVSGDNPPVIWIWSKAKPTKAALWMIDRYICSNFSPNIEIRPVERPILK